MCIKDVYHFDWLKQMIISHLLTFAVFESNTFRYDTPLLIEKSLVFIITSHRKLYVCIITKYVSIQLRSIIGRIEIIAHRNNNAEVVVKGKINV